MTSRCWPWKRLDRVHGVADGVGQRAGRAKDVVQPLDHQPLLRPVRGDDAHGLLPKLLRGIGCLARRNDGAGAGVVFVAELVRHAPIQEPEQGDDGVGLEEVALAAAAVVVYETHRRLAGVQQRSTPASSGGKPASPLAASAAVG